MEMLLTNGKPRVELFARDYQQKDDDESFRLWDSGVVGVLTRAFTGSGKTPMACLKIRRWLSRGPDYRAMIVSYERDLVWQFAQEVEDFLGITPGIEMADDHCEKMPRVIVASRQTLLPVNPATDEQVHALSELGVPGMSFLSQRVCKRLLCALQKYGATEEMRDEVERLRDIPESHGGWSRLHKFDPKLNWLVFFDEAHRHAHSLKSVGHIVDWFEKNPMSRRGGLTATPKRGDGVSIGHKMFPGVAIDFPLFHVDRPCGVKEGWAVPYLQKYISVEGVDFKRIKQIAGDFDEADLERVLGEEGTLAKLVEPLLDMVGDRRTLIFCPGVDMAKNVALYINARSEAMCPECNAKHWYASKLIGDGAHCFCGKMIETAHVTKKGEQAVSINGSTPPKERKSAYNGHQAGRFQFLSVCGLCREGYNDPDVSCVAVFRPVSKKASSLAEQMKGRSCRPCRSIVSVLNELRTAEERAKAIALSEKPNALIVDLVGITGLADCASTIQIYADGLDDEVADRAAEILEEEAFTDDVNVEETIRRAREEIEEEKSRIKAEKDAAERRKQEEVALRAKADAKVKYSAHDVGYGSNVSHGGVTEAQTRYIRSLGMNIHMPISKNRAGRIIIQLRLRKPPSEVALENKLPADQWEQTYPSEAQIWRLGRLRIHPSVAKTPFDASEIIGAWKNASEYETRKMRDINRCADGDSLTAIGKDLLLAKLVLPAEAYQRLVTAGKEKRAALI